MLPKKHRLPAFILPKVYRKGRTINGENLILKSLFNHKDYSRFAIVISAKTIKKAYQRNLTKRRLSAIINQYYDKIRKGEDFVLIIKKETGFKELEEELKRIFDVENTFIKKH